MTFQGIYYVKLVKPKLVQLDSIVGATSTRLNDRFSLWQYQVPNPDTGKPWKFTFLQTSETEIWIATDLDLLKAVLESLSADGQAWIEPVEWKEIPGDSPVWAVRRYRRDEIKDPFAAGILISEGIHVSAEAISFSYNRSKKTALLRIITNSSDQCLQVWRSLPGVSMIKVKPDQWQVSFPVNSELHSIEKIYLVYFMFGFGVFA
jgi:hypothetical protein